MWCPPLACPECRRPIRPGDSVAFECESCGRSFAFAKGIFRFLTSERAAAAAEFARQYRDIRTRDGHRGRTPGFFRGLPEVAADDPHADEWRIRRESFGRLSGIIPAGARVLDVGAGCGWLSHRLASTGRRVVAVDRVDDEDDGLGACRHYGVEFAAVQADFDALPFEPAQFDVVVLNASLHYAPDPAATLAHAREMLAPGGTLAVMDSPMFMDDSAGRTMVDAQLRSMMRERGQPAIRPGAGFLTYGGLARAAGALGLRAQFFPSRGPLAWRARREIGRLRLRRAPAAFGVWVAR